MHYVYLLESESDKNRRCTGLTTDLKTRRPQRWKRFPHLKISPVVTQNLPGLHHPPPSRPFERYLKSGSGRAFANRHLWTIQE
jgi:putative endonuclease